LLRFIQNTLVNDTHFNMSDVTYITMIEKRPPGRSAEPTEFQQMTIDTFFFCLYAEQYLFTFTNQARG